MRAAIVGYGFIASQGHVPAYLRRADVQIVAIADTCAARLSVAKQDFKDARLYLRPEELIAEEAKRLDFIDITTPPAFHTAIAANAIEHGIHVLCEKPLATSANDVQRLMELAAKKHCVLFPCHNYRHAPVVKAVREIIDSGRIGKVTAVSLSTFRISHAKGVREWKPDWRRELEYSGGGIAMDHGSHTFYLCFDWLGGYPRAISAKMGNASTAFDTEDNFSATLTFPGGTANVSLSWTAGIRKVIYVVQGQRGAVTVDDDDLQIIQQQNDRDVLSWGSERQSIKSNWGDASHIEWFNSLFDDFRQAIQAGHFVGRDTKDAFHCIQVIEAAYRSARARCIEVEVGDFLS